MSTNDTASTGGRASAGRGRGAATRAALVRAAREVFLRDGYDRAPIADIVATAGASVGSLYHHFSGKADLYLTVYGQLQREQAALTRQAVRAAKADGLTSPMDLFLAGARGYLGVCVDRREFYRIFVRGDSPPGFEPLWRKNVADWVHRNAEFFAAVGEPLDEAVAIVMTGGLLLAVGEIASAKTDERARQLAAGVLEVFARLGIGRFRKAAAAPQGSPAG